MIRILLPANINFSTPTAKAKAILREYFPRISKHPTFSICFRHNTRACAMFSESWENNLLSPVHLVAVELKFWRKIRILTNLTAEKNNGSAYPGYPVKRKTVQFWGKNNPQFVFSQWEKIGISSSLCLMGSEKKLFAVGFESTLWSQL